MKRYAVPLALLAACLLPANALADIGFRGKTGQGKRVVLRTDDDGRLQVIDIGWRAPCRLNAGVRLANATKHIPPFDSLTRDRFVDEGRYRQPVEGGLRGIAYTRVVGNRVSERRWRGIFRIRVRVFDGGRELDRCYARTRWRVLRRG